MLFADSVIQSVFLDCLRNMIVGNGRIRQLYRCVVDPLFRGYRSRLRLRQFHKTSTVPDTGSAVRHSTSSAERKPLLR